MKKFIFQTILIALLVLFIPSFNVYAAQKTLHAVADTTIDQQNPDAHLGAAWHSLVRNGASKNICYLARFEDANLPPEVVLDKAEFRFYIYTTYHGNNPVLQIGANDTNVLVTDEFPHNTISWNNSPTRLTDYRYTVYSHVNVSTTGQKRVNITKLYNAWLTSEIENNGLYLCVAPSQPQTSFDIYTREKTDLVGVQPVIVLEYHTATLGEPPREEDTSTPTPTFSFDLISPDNTILTTPPYTFKWQNTHPSDPARQHLTIIVKKKNTDSTLTQVIKRDVPTTWTEYETSINLEDGDYEWYVEAYQMNTKVYETSHKVFKVQKDSPTETTTTQVSPTDSTSSVDSANTTNNTEVHNNVIQGDIYIFLLVALILLVLLVLMVYIYVIYKGKNKQGMKKKDNK